MSAGLKVICTPAWMYNLTGVGRLNRKGLGVAGKQQSAQESAMHPCSVEGELHPGLY